LPDIGYINHDGTVQTQIYNFPLFCQTLSCAISLNIFVQVMVSQNDNITAWWCLKLLYNFMMLAYSYSALLTNRI